VTSIPFGDVTPYGPLYGPWPQLAAEILVKSIDLTPAFTSWCARSNQERPPEPARVHVGVAPGSSVLVLCNAHAV
jgi:hypothetical protein